MRVKGFYQFSESTEDIDWTYFKNFKYMVYLPTTPISDLKFDKFDKYKIDQDDLIDVFQEVEDNLYCKHSFNQRIEVEDRDKLKHTLRIVIMVENSDKSEIESPSGHLSIIDSFREIISELEKLEKRINSFFGMVISKYTCPSIISARSHNFILEFTREIKDPDGIKSEYLEYLKNTKNNKKISNPNPDKESMARKVAVEILSHIEWYDVMNTSELRNSIGDGPEDLVRIIYDDNLPGGFAVSIDGEILTVDSLRAGDDPKLPSSYIDWEFVDQKFNI